MREIKFKVFSKIDNKFLENIHYIDNQGDLYFSAFGKPIIYENQENYKICEFTWLYDKNWKEIYENEDLLNNN